MKGKIRKIRRQREKGSSLIGFIVSCRMSQRKREWDHHHERCIEYRKFWNYVIA